MEGHHFPVNLSQIQLRNEEFLPVEHWVKDIPRVRSYNRAASSLDPLAFPRPQCAVRMKLPRQILSRHYQAHRQNKTSAFQGVVSAGYVISFLSGWPHHAVD